MKRGRRTEQRDWDEVAVLAFDGHNVIAGVIGGRRNGEFQYFGINAYESALRTTPREFKRPIILAAGARTPAGVRVERTEYQGMAVEAGFNYVERQWYVRSTTGIAPQPEIVDR